MKRWHVFLIALSFFVPVAQIAFPETVRSESQEKECRLIRDIPYVENGGKRQQLDLWLPRGVEKPPLLVWVHGGGWRNGDKFPFPLTGHLLDSGFALASINYRYSTQEIFPAQLVDCKSAIRWLRAHADRYGYDPDRIGVWGNSAGGHLVALLGTTGKNRQFDLGEHLDQSSDVCAVVELYGPTDFTMILRNPGGFKNASASMKLLLGDSPDKMAQRAAMASPVTYVSKDSAPFLILHGTGDKTVDIEQSRCFHKALEDVGAKSELLVVPDVGHDRAIVLAPGVREKIDLFLKQYLVDHKDGSRSRR